MSEALSAPTVLVIDDRPSIRQLVFRALADAGYRVIEAEDGSHALDLLKRIGSVDLVLLDVVMPYLNGVECARRLRDRYAEQRIIFMSGQPVEVLARSGVADLALPFLPKPFTPEELLAKVEAVMRRPAPAGTLPEH